MEELNDNNLTLSISSTFEENFRYLMSKINKVEWGGVVVYDINGSILDNTIHIEILDFFLMDVGNVGTTEHDYAEDTEFIELLMDYPGKPYGLIHSHVGSVFYSATDETEIKKNEHIYNAGPGYLSVVTNAMGDILVRLSKKIDPTSTIKLEIGNKTKLIEEVFSDIYFVETQLNLNDQFSSDVIDERLTAIAYAKEVAKKKKEKENKKNNKKNNKTNYNNYYGNKGKYPNANGGFPSAQMNKGSHIDDDELYNEIEQQMSKSVIP